MTADAILSALKAGGWSPAEYATNLGYVAEVYRGDRRVSVAAPSSPWPGGSCGRE